jgi:hypothetical protein
MPKPQRVDLVSLLPHPEGAVASIDRRASPAAEKRSRPKVACRELANLQVILETLLGVEIPEIVDGS